MRIRAVSARKAPMVRSEAVPEFGIGGVILDRESHQVRKGDARVQLTPLEFRILDTLAANEGRVIGFSRLVELAWGFDGGNLVSLRHHVSNLRRKLADLPDHPLQVDVVYGAGYLLVVPKR
jgi:two-component system response regulator MtrA